MGMNPGFTYKESIDQFDQPQLPLNPENAREKKHGFSETVAHPWILIGKYSVFIRDIRFVVTARAHTVSIFCLLLYDQ